MASQRRQILLDHSDRIPQAREDRGEEGDSQEVGGWTKEREERRRAAWVFAGWVSKGERKSFLRKVDREKEGRGARERRGAREKGGEIGGGGERTRELFIGMFPLQGRRKNEEEEEEEEEIGEAEEFHR